MGVGIRLRHATLFPTGFTSGEDQRDAAIEPDSENTLHFVNDS